MMRLFSLLLLLLLTPTISGNTNANNKNNTESNNSKKVSTLLNQANSALSQNQLQNSIHYYEVAANLIDLDNNKYEDADFILIILSVFTNWGTALSEIGDVNGSVQKYKTALRFHAKLEIEDNQDISNLAAQAAFFLGMTLQDEKKYQEAVQAYGLASRLDPNNWAALANLGSIFQDHLKIEAEALAAYNAAYEILTRGTPLGESNADKSTITDPPFDDDMPSILSDLQYRIGLAINSRPEGQKCVVDTGERDCRELATHAFSLAVKLNPDNQLAQHMLAAITADATMKRASNSYVRSLFEDYAENFEHSLVDELGYTGFERLRKAFDRAFNHNVPQFDKVVDAGCGTGLVGEQFRDVSHYMIGVDLSESIIAQAEKARPNLYNKTIAGDVIEVFHNVKPISLIIAGDSYIYFGDLVPLFYFMASSLEDDGVVAFTLENVSVNDEQLLNKTKPDWKWKLTPSGRFAHRKEYVTSVALSNQLEIIHYEELIDFRFENGVGVRGHVFILQKKKMSLSGGPSSPRISDNDVEL